MYLRLPWRLHCGAMNRLALITWLPVFALAASVWWEILT